MVTNANLRKVKLMIIDLLRQEHRNMEKLLLVLEQELSVFDWAERPDYEVVWKIISYFKVYPDAYHHPQEDLIFKKVEARDPVAAANLAISRPSIAAVRTFAPGRAGGRQCADRS